MTENTTPKVGQNIDVAYEMTTSYGTSYELEQEDLDLMKKEGLTFEEYCRKWICNIDLKLQGEENEHPVDNLEIKVDGKKLVECEPKTITVAHFIYDYPVDQWIQKIDDLSYEALKKALKKSFERSGELDDDVEAKVWQELGSEYKNTGLHPSLRVEAEATITIESLELKIFIKQITI